MQLALPTANDIIGAIKASVGPGLASDKATSIAILSQVDTTAQLPRSTPVLLLAICSCRQLSPAA